jgi:hypothetical protein
MQRLSARARRILLDVYCRARPTTASGVGERSEHINFTGNTVSWRRPAPAKVIWPQTGQVSSRIMPVSPYHSASPSPRPAGRRSSGPCRSRSRAAGPRLGRADGAGRAARAACGYCAQAGRRRRRPGAEARPRGADPRAGPR